MSLDVSPDGRTIIFELLGDLYTIPITGGGAKRITSGMAFNRQPRYSPDGKKLVLISDRGGSANIWIADSNGGGARQLSDLHGAPFGAVTSPVWSPDGRKIVVSQVMDATQSGPLAPSQEMRWLLATYDVESGQMRWLSDTAADRARATLGPAFGPDTGTVYAAIDAFRKDYYSEAEDWRIVAIDMATARIQPETVTRSLRAGMRPAASRDGRYLVYASGSGSRIGLRLRDLHTLRERWLVREALDGPPLWPALDSRDLIPGYAFTPDSKSLIAAYGGKIHQIHIATGRASVIPFHADVERVLGPMTVHQFSLPDTAVRTRAVMQPALSHAGDRVAFTALDRIWIMELPHDGRPPGQPHRLTSDSVGEFYPSWSPDGSWIAYSTWKDGEGGAVRRTRVKREEDTVAFHSERLTSDTAVYFQTAVAPDGQRVVAVRMALPAEPALTRRFADGPRQSFGWAVADPTLAWVPVGGGTPRVIISLAQEQHVWGHERYPVDQVYFTADRDRVYVGLTSWRWDGTDRQTALILKGVEAGPSPQEATGVLSPDTRRALITRMYALFECSLSNRPAAGPRTIELDQVRTQPFGAAAGAAHRWGTALAPWISWSGNGQRVLFGQGGTLFVGEVRFDRWAFFARVDVPLMIPVDLPRGTLVLHGGRLVTMRGREVIEHGDLVVRDNRIMAVGPVGTVAIPRGAHVLDASGTTILPGYIDVHDHTRHPKGVHPQQCWHCLTEFAYGVTASRDPQPSFGPDVFTYRERERVGDFLGPRVFSTGIAHTVTDPPIQSLDDAREAIRPNADYFGSETFKVYHNPLTGRRARQLLAMALAEVRLNATVEGASNAELDLTVILDGFQGLEHALPIRIYDDVATLIAQSATAHTQTYGLVAGWQYMLRRFSSELHAPKMRRFAPPSARALCPCTATTGGPPELDQLLPLVSGAARIMAKGGRVAMGSHGDIPGIGFHYEMWLHALAMSNREVLRAATIEGATAIGHARDLGSLEPGKLADLQVLDRNPLQDIRNTTSIRYVMKNGRLYQGDDLTEIWPRGRPLEAMYLWESTLRANQTQKTRQAH
jgi:imidazolonepropionase-like amidohydrolase